MKLNTPDVEGTKAEADAKIARRAKIVFIILDIYLLDMRSGQVVVLDWMERCLVIDHSGNLLGDRLFLRHLFAQKQTADSEGRRRSFNSTWYD